MAKKSDIDRPEAAGPAEPSVSPAPDSDAAPSATSPDADETPQTTSPDAAKTSQILSRLADSARTAAIGLWRHARRLSLHGARVTRPLEIVLRATGLVVVVLAPLWPIFGADIDGWWDWVLTTLANLGIGIALFGAGETIRMIAEIYGVLVRESEPGREPLEEDEA